MRCPISRTLLLACAALAASAGQLAGPPPAAAASYSVSIMMDDNQLVYATREQRRAALDEMKQLGVEAVRATVLWKAVAPNPHGRRKPRRFNGARPGKYEHHQWDRYDDLVRDATQRGMVVYLNPTGPGPRWAHKRIRDPRAENSWRPSPNQFRKFMTAVGRRYSGRYRDENGGRPVLPRVTWWGIWNEPNQPGWLTPQAEKRRGAGWVVTAGELYRDLLVAGAKGLLKTGHADDLVMIGELAPLGTQKPAGRIPGVRPGLFMREMFCLDRRFRPFTGRRAEARGCSKLDRLSILERFPRLAFAHHPYNKKRAPWRREPGRDAITMANIGTLPRLLDRIAARTGLLPPEMPIFITEYGYETNPPDPLNGVPLATQAQWINEGDYIAWRHPRIFSNTQFMLYDAPPRDEHPRDSALYWRTYQSGLRMSRESGGAAKPALTAYKFPLVVRGQGSNVRIWGQARFAPNGARYPVLIQVKRPGTNNWVRSGDPVQVTHGQGYFQVRRPHIRGATWRAVWSEPDFSRFEVSREASPR